MNLPLPPECDDVPFKMSEEWRRERKIELLPNTFEKAL